MDHRHPLHNAPAQRSLSGSYAAQQASRRPPLPSRLGSARSISQPANIVDLTTEASRPAHIRTSSASQPQHSSSSASSDVADQHDDRDNGRPAKRARTASGYAFRTGTADEATADAKEDIVQKIVPGSPLPQLRKINATASRRTTTRTRRAATDRATRRANGLEAPSIATRLPSPRSVADYSPWTGQHPEDIMSETVVKAGYFDKPPGPSPAETNSAKPTIWPNLSQKNNMGLQTLSYLFTSVMEKRQAMGKCTAPSTFKPPPRVTVTDTKREAWLRDLSNSDVPLRKQSRTIPHGIRGKLLMEQCLSKAIPMPRAVWLAKCVGANELRAFRRKGVSGVAAATGEQKWIREWTVHVEQFVEAVIASCGQPGWQAKMDYAVKLATSFYVERLVERDHYLDWIVSSFAGAGIERLPVWTILVQLYWKDVTAFGARGRRLAGAILENLHRINTGTLQVHDMLGDRWKKLVVVLAVTNRGCLVSSRNWETYGYLLAPKAFVHDGGKLESPAQNIAKRNSRLSAPLHKTTKTTRCALLQLYALLDDVRLQIDQAKLLESCRGKIANLTSLISALLNWCGSRYRIGLRRIYLTADLIARLHTEGENTDDAILSYLRSASTEALDIANVHKAIAELVMKECFSAGRYLQWLITSGTLSAGQNPTLSTGLLLALPSDSLPVHQQFTRRSLMKRLGNNQEEPSQIERLVLEVHHQEDGVEGVLGSDFVERLEALTASAKLQLAHRLSRGAIEEAKANGLSLQYYCIVRDILHRCRDCTALAEVLYAAIHTDDTTLLATISDTVDAFAQTFAVLGHLEPLLNKLSQRYTVLRSQQVLDRTFVLALAAPVARFPERMTFAKLLESDLAMCEQRDSRAVCSPASDNLVGMQASTLDSDDEIDAVFASGNTMDEQLMQRVFARIVQRAAKPAHITHRAPSKICSWFGQLRAVDTSVFDQLARHYAQTSLKNHNDTSESTNVLSALVAAECLQLESVVQLTKQTGTPAAACLAIHLLTSEAAINVGMHATEVFRFFAKQTRYAEQSLLDLISLMVLAMEEPSFEVEQEKHIDLILDYAVRRPEDAVKIFINMEQSPVIANSRDRLIGKLVNLAQPRNLPDMKRDTPSLIAAAGPLSIGVHTAVLAYYAQTEANDGKGDSEELQSAILEAISNGCEVWPQLLEATGPRPVKTIYGWAREKLLDGAPHQQESTAAQTEETRRCLDIVDVAHRAAGDEDIAPSINAVVERLKTVEQRLHAQETNENGQQEVKQSLPSLHVFLHLSILYATNPSLDNDSLSQSRANLLATLCTLLLHPKLQPYQAMLEYIFDVASAVSDTLPQETLHVIAKSISSSTADPRLTSILGTTTPPDAWLALVSHPQPPQVSQQQRALLKQASQVPGRLPKASVVRSDSRAESKTTPFPLRRWEIMGDATPSVGENDTSLSLGLFSARKV